MSHHNPKDDLERMENELEHSLEEMGMTLIESSGESYYELTMTGHDQTLDDMKQFVQRYTNENAIKRTSDVQEASHAFFQENKAYLLTNESLNPYENSDRCRIKWNSKDVSYDEELVTYFGKALKRIVEHLYSDVTVHSFAVGYDLNDEVVSIESIVVHTQEEDLIINDYNEHHLALDLMLTLFDGTLAVLHLENEKVYSI